MPSRHDWARYRTNKGIKFHAQLDLLRDLTCFVVLIDGKMADIQVARKRFRIELDSIYTFGKGY